MQKRVGDATHWLCEQRGICKARVHTKGMEVVKRTNYHTHAPDEQDVSCCETKAGIKRRARESLDSSHHIVGGVYRPYQRERLPSYQSWRV